jgi:hypothetical protein
MDLEQAARQSGSGSSDWLDILRAGSRMIGENDAIAARAPGYRVPFSAFCRRRQYLAVLFFGRSLGPVDLRCTWTLRSNGPAGTRFDFGC